MQSFILDTVSKQVCLISKEWSTIVGLVSLASVFFKTLPSLPFYSDQGCPLIFLEYPMKFVIKVTASFSAKSMRDFIRET